MCDIAILIFALAGIGVAVWIFGREKFKDNPANKPEGRPARGENNDHNL